MGVAEWINSYNHPIFWTREILEEHANILEIWVGDDLAGYMWFMFESEDTVMMHMSMREEYKYSWTAKAIGDYHKFAELVGAKKITVESAPHLNRLLLRLGYDKISSSRFQINLPNEWSYYGRHSKNIQT